MDYKLLNEDDHSYELKDPKGKTIKIAKQAISDALHSKIRGFADGGKVGEDGDPMPPASLTPNEKLDEDQFLSTMTAQPTAYEPLSPAQKAAQWTGDVLGGAVKDTATAVKQGIIDPITSVSQFGADVVKSALGEPINQAPKTNLMASTDTVPADALNKPPVSLGEFATQQSQVMQPPAGSKLGQMGEIGALEQKALGALETKSKAEQQLAKTQAALLEEHNKQIASREELFQKNLGNVDKEIDQWAKAYGSGVVNPNRVWQNASTGSKVSAAIGLILGGLGQGLTGGPNQALQVIQNSIDRDIDAQKANLNKAGNMLSFYMKKYGNMQAAESATRLRMGAAVQGQLQQAAATAGTDIAKAQNQMAQVQIQQQMLPLKMQVARWNAAVQSGNPGMMVSAVVPENQQQKAFEELKAMQTLGSGITKAMAAFDKIDKLNTVVGRAARLGFERADVKALREPITAELSKETAGRFTEQDAHMLDTLWPKPLDNEQTIKTKRSAIKSLLMQKMHSPLLEAYGIPYKTNPIQGFKPGDFK